MTINVDPIPPAPESPPGGDAPGPSEGGPGAPTDVAAPVEWTDADIKQLIDVLRGPYDKIADATGDESYRLSKIDEIMLVGSLTTWMPVSWARAGQHGNLPLIVALPLTAMALVAVNLPRLGHWNKTHNPEEQIVIPFIMRRGTARVGPRPTPQPPRSDGPGAGPADRPVDQPIPAPAGPPADVGHAPSVDGGPPADSLDDIRRSYQH